MKRILTEFTKHSVKSSNGERAELLKKVSKKYGFIPNLMAYMAESKVAVEAYLALQEIMTRANLSAADQQVAQLTVSIYNRCEFCKIAHRAMGKHAGVSSETIESLLNKTEITHRGDRAIVKITQAILDKQGWLEEHDVQDFLSAGFSKENIYELILAITTKTLSNYSNHLTEPEANDELVALL